MRHCEGGEGERGEEVCCHLRLIEGGCVTVGFFGVYGAIILH